MAERARWCGYFCDLDFADPRDSFTRPNVPSGGREAAYEIPGLGLTERTSGHIGMDAIDSVRKEALIEIIREVAKAGPEIHTDELKSYLWLDSSEFATNPSITPKLM